MKKLIFLLRLLSLILMLGVYYNATSQVIELTAPAGTPWIWSDYVDPSIPDDKVFIFCSPDVNGNPVLGSLTVTGGSVACTHLWCKYEEDSTSADYQNFVPFFVSPIDPGPTVTNLTSGFYLVIVTCNPGTPNQTVYCRRAHVFVNESIVDFDPILPSCQPFTITGGIIGAVNDFTIYDPPATPYYVESSTSITVCFWINHSYVSDLGFYLIGPNGARVDLLPPVSAWDIPGVTDLDPFVLPNPCATTALNTACNSGNNYNNFCFTSDLPAGNPAFTACICSMSNSFPITGTFASAETWSPIFGQSVANSEWAVQIFDCYAADIGFLQRVTITFDGQSMCGNANYTFDSGPVNVMINDASCDSATATTYVLPIKTNASHTLANEVTAHWESFPTPWNPAWGSSEFDLNPTPVINPIPNDSTQFKLIILDHLYDSTGTEIPASSNYYPCTHYHSETFDTITPYPIVLNIPEDICINSNGIQLQALYPNGTWSSATCGEYNPLAGQFGCLTADGYFFPALANLGPNMLTYSIGGACADDTTFFINVVGAPILVDIVDTLCNSINTQFKVQITLSSGNPSSYSFTDCTNNQPLQGTLSANTWTSGWLNSPSSYCIKVTDSYDCNPQLITGYHDCDCESQAASMPQAVQELCAYDSAIVIHNNDYFLDPNDTWEYVVHTAPFAFPGDVLARNRTGVFYFDSTLMAYNTTYYISHVVGENIGTAVNPVVSFVDTCLSISQGTPVRWFENPSPDAGLSVTVCGNVATLAAVPPSLGQGAWSEPSSLGVIYTPNFSTPGATVTIPNFDTNQYGCSINTSRTFRWTITNGPCAQFDEVVATFKPQPNAYAGENAIVCGLQTTLAAQYSICPLPVVSLGFWSGDGQFQNQLSPTSEVNVDLQGCYDFIWTEFNDNCSSTSYVTICFLDTPEVDFGADTIEFAEGSSVILNPGTFAAYEWSSGDTTTTIDASSEGNYSVTVTDENGCSGSGSVWVQMQLGIESPCLEATVSIYPNPASGILNVSSNDFKIQQIVVYNLLGEVIILKKVFATTCSMDVSSLSNGVYFLQIISTDQQSAMKTVKVLK